MDSRACTAQGGLLDSIPSVTIMPGVRVDCYRLLPIQIRRTGALSFCGRDNTQLISQPKHPILYELLAARLPDRRFCTAASCRVCVPAKHTVSLRI